MVVRAHNRMDGGEEKEGISSCLALVSQCNSRLYPVLAGCDLVGVISRRDIIAALTKKWQWSS